MKTRYSISMNHQSTTIVPKYWVIFREWLILLEREITMRKKEDLKTVRKTVLMTAETAKDIEREAKERGIKPNAVMNDRLRHNNNGNTPAKMAEFQDYANEAVKALAKYSEAEAKYFERKANLLWTF